MNPIDQARGFIAGTLIAMVAHGRTLTERNDISDANAILLGATMMKITKYARHAVMIINEPEKIVEDQRMIFY